MIKRTSTSKNDRIKLIHANSENLKLQEQIKELQAKLEASNKGESPEPIVSVEQSQEVSKNEQTVEQVPSNTPIGDKQ